MQFAVNVGTCGPTVGKTLRTEHLAMPNDACMARHFAPSAFRSKAQRGLARLDGMRHLMADHRARFDSALAERFNPTRSRTVRPWRLGFGIRRLEL